MVAGLVEVVDVMVAGKRLAVFSIRENSKTGNATWVRAGTAFVNKDLSLNILLDCLPLDGKLHVREAGKEATTEAGPSANANANAGRFGSEGVLDSAGVQG